MNCKNCHHTTARMPDGRILHHSQMEGSTKRHPRHHSGKLCMEGPCTCIRPE